MLPQAVWFRRDAPFTPARDHAWVEMTHCGGAFNEAHNYWVYRARGSNLWINVGRTIAFGGHEDAAVHFLNRTCGGERWCGEVNCLMQCDADLPLILRKARHSGFDSVQFINHCDMRCGLCGHEIVLTGIAGTEACNPKVAYRRGLNASEPCECVASPTLTSERGRCATCR